MREQFEKGDLVLWHNGNIKLPDWPFMMDFAIVTCVMNGFVNVSRGEFQEHFGTNTPNSFLIMIEKAAFK